MIASRKHGFIFIKTMKTAGTSIEFVLSPYCASEDIVTPIGAQQDLARFAASGVLPRNFATSDIEKRYRKGLQKGNAKLLKAVRRDLPEGSLWAHALPDEIRSRVGAFWDAAYRFTVERHPYDKVLSRAAMTRFDIDRVVFDDRLYVGHPWYLSDGRLLVDNVVMFDRLDDDVAQVMTRFGLPRTTLPRARYTERDRRPAREQLSATQRDFIYEQCAPEFELFGWER